MFSLKGRTALVTGASRGLGFAMAKALAENGATVIVNARSADGLMTAAAKIDAEPLPFDVTDPKASRAALEAWQARHSGQQRRHPAPPTRYRMGGCGFRPGDQRQPLLVLPAVT
jgi:NAD(P)-dependent dehydrogenase (short-subunit alcohol dehydrogenase family)